MLPYDKDGYRLVTVWLLTRLGLENQGFTGEYESIGM